MFWTKRGATEPLLFGGKPLVIVRSPRARQVRLAIDIRSRSVRLTLPTRAPLQPALAWAEGRRGWAEAQLDRLPRPCPIVPGMIIPLAGRDLRLEWRADWPRSPHIAEDALRVGGPRDLLQSRVLRFIKAEARRILTAETQAIAETAGVGVAAVSIGDPTTRWGSCSSSGAIRYSWRLILAPDFVRRATVAHEVAHRVHMNHSRAFHGLAARLTGFDPAPARHWLRVHGSELQAFGREWKDFA